MSLKVDLHREDRYETEAGRDVRTKILIRTGVVAAVVFVGVLLLEGALRSGYDPTYHMGSALSLGDRGWIQITNFLLLGLAMLAFAVGVHRKLDGSIGAALLAVFGLAIVASGVFVMDSMRGYPPGTATGTPAVLSWHQQIHNTAGPVAFLALFGACLALSRRLTGRWRLYTLLTAIAGLALTVWTAAAWQSDAANTGLVQRGLLLVYLSWIALLGMHLAISFRRGIDRRRSPRLRRGTVRYWRTGVYPTRFGNRGPCRPKAFHP